MGITMLTSFMYSGIIPSIILHRSLVSLAPMGYQVDFNRLLGILCLGELLGSRDGLDDHSAT